MAKNPSAYLLFLAILVLATATSSSAQILPPFSTLPPVLQNSTNVAQVQALGVLSCTVTGTPIPFVPSPPVVGALVNLSCDGGRTTLAQAVTNTAGFYNVTLNVVQGLLFNTTDCALFVGLPLVNCTIFPPRGVLRIPLGVLTIVPGLLGNVLVLIGQIFRVIGV
ncbi:uncharacterized protein LOC132800021 [Ziziphus jujuba]|uniref:Uncharacterized protein LOC125419631 n=2 Tax=Ziziphus jujuba TaxID=326968 RepID=A0ABM3I718_ZIZJJ|nr:uncharacterized protein LOC125419631 [Ziziphus jujuba]XP_060668894.1 uncharacterized protein LOC132800021 [Ziziphus jujuba]KAH7512868.1 hypothetical protein FEM48_Zijuj12G0135900 [Ziziphus jujuba var. spinosa]